MEPNKAFIAILGILTVMTVIIYVLVYFLYKANQNCNTAPTRDVGAPRKTPYPIPP